MHHSLVGNTAGKTAQDSYEMFPDLSVMLLRDPKTADLGVSGRKSLPTQIYLSQKLLEGAVCNGAQEGQMSPRTAL